MEGTHIQDGKLMLNKFMLSKILRSPHLSFGLSGAPVIMCFLPHELRNNRLQLGVKAGLPTKGGNELGNSLVNAKCTTTNTADGRMLRVGVKGGIAPSTKGASLSFTLTRVLGGFVMLAAASRWKDR